jgi:hypothetical protein
VPVSTRCRLRLLVHNLLCPIGGHTDKETVVGILVKRRRKAVPAVNDEINTGSAGTSALRQGEHTESALVKLMQHNQHFAENNHKGRLLRCLLARPLRSVIEELHLAVHSIRAKHTKSGGRGRRCIDILRRRDPATKREVRDSDSDEERSSKSRKNSVASDDACKQLASQPASADAT